MLRVFYICTRFCMQVSYVDKLEMNSLLYWSSTALIRVYDIIM